MTSTATLLALASLYGQVARALGYPDEELRAELDDGSFGEDLRVAVSMLAEAQEIVPALAEMARATADLKDSPLQLPEEHSYLFARQVLASPYAGSYGGDQAFGHTQVMADLAALYAAFGLRVAEGAGELPDHAGVVLEFLAVLAVKEAYAMEQGWAERATVCQEARALLLREHVGDWFPEMARRIASQARLRFYPAVVELAGRLLEIETRAEHAHA